MKNTRHLFFLWGLVVFVFAGCSTVTPPIERGVRTAEVVCEITRPERPDGISGISHKEGNRYYCVDDSDGLLYEVAFELDEDESDGVFNVLRFVTLSGRKDLEGCAVDPLDGSVWVSDESDHSIRRFDPMTGRETANVAVPEIYKKNMGLNRSFEALAISPDGLKLYTANEDTLTCDGAVATAEHGGLVRIQEFVRKDIHSSWSPSRQFFYPTEKIAGADFEGMAISGVVALAVPGDGSLLVLEREMSKKNPLFPSFRAQLYEIDLHDSGKPVKKKRVWHENTMFVNYEGFCFGPVLKDGSPSLILVSDGDGLAEELILVLALKETKGN